MRFRPAWTRTARSRTLRAHVRRVPAAGRRRGHPAAVRPCPAKHATSTSRAAAPSRLCRECACRRRRERTTEQYARRRQRPRNTRPSCPRHAAPAPSSPLRQAGRTRLSRTRPCRRRTSRAPRSPRRFAQPRRHRHELSHLQVVSPSKVQESISLSYSGYAIKHIVTHESPCQRPSCRSGRGL